MAVESQFHDYLQQQKMVLKFYVCGHIPLDLNALTAMATVAGFPQAQPKSTATFTRAKYRPRLAFNHISISFV